MRTTDLQKCEGQLGILRFSDGHAVKARLVHVDIDDRKEVIYDVVEVLEPGQPQWANVKPGTTAAGSLADVAGFESLDDTT
jgi:hypothetical protein